MSDTTSDTDKTLRVGTGQRKPLSLKRETDTVRQSFSGGRTKAVVVETTKRRRILKPGEKPDAGSELFRAPEPAVTAAPPPRAAAPAANAPRPTPAALQPAAAPVAPQRSRAGSGMVLKALTDEERDARSLALNQARVREAEDRRRAEDDARERADDEARIARENAEAEHRQQEEEARKAAEEHAKRRAEEEARRRLGEAEVPHRPAPSAAATPQRPAARGPAPSYGFPERNPSRPAGERPASRSPAPSYGFDRPPPRPATGGGYAGDRAPSSAPRPAPSGDSRPPLRTLSPARPKRVETRPAVAPKRPATGGDDRRRGRLTVTNALEDDRERSLAAARRKLEKQKRQANGFNPSSEKITREVVIPEAINVQELANRMAERAVDVIRLLMRQGQMVKITDILDADTAQIVAEEMGHSVRRVSAADVEEGLFTGDDADEAKIGRPPVVTIMGHVDHGKTSLLDAIRNANVVAGEAGGITQHIGAYQVDQGGQSITFIDTPGHAAFTAMRARGAQATDIAILVVAADDGVMPQTVESINHARAAGVPIIVAINKIDKPDANPDRVRNELLRHEIVVEAMGGETQDVEVSALKKLNLDGLLEAILLQAEVLDLKANPEREAEGVVIEAKLDKGRGPVGTVLVQRGTLKVGDIVVAGGEWGRVRALLNDHSEQVKEAGPSMPVEILGLQGTPEAGDRFGTVENEARAREITEYRQRLKRDKAAARQSGARGSLAEMMSQLQTAGQKTFPLVVKADVQGSAEAIVSAIDKIGTSEVMAQVVHSGVGAITESDINLAAASNAAIMGFNVRANAQARAAAEREGVEIRYYNIIYALTDDVKAAMSGMLSPERRETFLGNAEILQVFNITKVGKVAGCRVVEGKVERGAGVRLIRDNVVVHEGKLSTLKRFKDEVREVQMGQECGMAFEKYEDMREGDVIECYRVEEVARTL